MTRPESWKMLVNAAALNVGWFACVLGDAWGRPLAGPLVVAALLALHFAMVPRRDREAALLLGAALVGFALDSALVLAGAIGFDAGSGPLAPTKLWMVALWMNFATGLNLALYWLAGRPALAAALGAVGGPMAYYGGVQLGALALPGGALWGLGLVALGWTVAMPLLLTLNAALGRLRPGPGAVHLEEPR
ncbi:DUF2878 domain-containing protein [Thiohalorhabdus methylotrophus]|uniref:DUF2878 domain-containing protein n=1 Tax=Thiohalorhabdus methylotrophus TaxID=3242694 RepID=A0ABV4TWQ1_9GAMM